MKKFLRQNVLHNYKFLRFDRYRVENDRCAGGELLKRWVSLLLLFLFVSIPIVLECDKIGSIREYCEFR